VREGRERERRKRGKGKGRKGEGKVGEGICNLRKNFLATPLKTSS